MSTETADVDFDQPPRWRIHFTLKTLLVLVTLSAIWLTISTLRARQADRVISRAAATYQLLAQPFDRPPSGMSIAVQQPGPGFHSPLPGRELVLRSGRLATDRTWIIQLAPNSAMAATSGLEINRILENHFLSNLAQLGFVQQGKPNKPLMDVILPKHIESFVATWYDPLCPEFVVTMQILRDNTQPLISVLIQAQGDQPIPGGRIGSWLGSTAAFIVGLLMLRVVLRSMLSWGWR